MRTPLAIVLLLATCSSANASSSLACSIEAKALQLTLEGVVSHGLGEQLTDVRGDLKLSHPLIASNLKAHALERQDVTQFWMTGRDLKIRLYRESTSGPGESVEIIMEATGKSSDEGMSYRGTFKAVLSHLRDGATEAETKTLDGKLACSSD